ncbi:MAG TPA: choice-of-anchor D domain-containing protein [Kofleriaceae bacterium]
MLKRGVCIALLVCGWSLDAAASITINPSPFDAGTALLNQPTSANGTLSSTTNVHVDLVITNSCSGGAGTFELSMTTNVNLNAPASLTLTYTPSQRGTRTCRVDVFDTGTMTLLGSFNVRGTGQQPATMSVTGTPDFGSLRWNNAAPLHTSSRNFTVMNSGDVTLDISSVAVSGGNAGDFTIAGSTTASILPGGAKTWTITFDPTAGGARSTTLTFSGNDPANPADSYTLTGTGTNAVIATPMDPSFGIVNIGSSALGNVPVNNVGGAPRGSLGVTSASITGGGGWITFAGCGGGANCTFVPALAIADVANVGVQCSPPATAAANDMQTATITFVSDTDSGTDNTATLTCVAGKSTLATSLNIATFGTALVGTTTNLMPITVTNTGNVATTFYLTKTGVALNQTAFTLSTPTGCGLAAGTPCTVQPMSTAMVNVTFTALFEGDINAGLTLTSPATPNPQLVLTGRGIDRHISLIDAVQFPDTFRNPGDAATIMPITVKNIGEYPLHVSQVLLDGAPNWQLAAEFVPFDVPGLGSHDVNVKFLPVTAGKAPDGILAVMSDDPKAALLNVVMSGNGRDRNVSFGAPGPIDFGNTGAGVPVSLTAIKRPENWLAVANLDDADFKIREIKSDMPDVFQVRQISGDDISNIDLPIGGSNKFEVVFLPPKVGEYTANITLFLDQDPLGQRTVEAHGNALFVDAHGGAGCSTGRGAGSGILLAFVALLRRKRRRA